MCGIAGFLSLSKSPIPELERRLSVMNALIAHRGPDGSGTWAHIEQCVGFTHRRLSIIDPKDGHQPMRDEAGNWVCYNGEIYNYLELRSELGGIYRTNSDTEVLLMAYRRWGEDCVSHFKGMFAFALWDEQAQKLFCARDRFGIKPFYYTQQNNNLLFASEIKALLPFVEKMEINPQAMNDYLTFQFYLDGKTLFKGIQELRPAHTLSTQNGVAREKRYWQVYYNIDFDHTERYFVEHLQALLEQSIKYHLRSDVPIGGYISGGLDSSIVSSLAAKLLDKNDFIGFTGKFTKPSGYDESHYAKILADDQHFPLEQINITAKDFVNNIEKVIYHLDMPVAGPGSFPQYMVSSLAAKHRKVVLGGQGGDEIFGGYTRYLIAYFEQCIKGAIDGSINSGNYVVTYESIIPNLTSLKNYMPMLKEFWKEGLFEDLDKRYFRLISRAPAISSCVRWENLGAYSPYDAFHRIFVSKNVGKESYFDRMTHFDFKTLLPALLQIEDRMSMAHGLESRVPFLDHELVEFAATIPANFKLKDGDMKHILKQTMGHCLPEAIKNRKDKMGFPVPFTDWIKDEAKDFVMDIFTSKNALQREYTNNKFVADKIQTESTFGRNIWGLLCLELWQKEFIDKASAYRALFTT